MTLTDVEKRECNTEAKRRWRLKDPERVKQIQARWAAKNPEKNKANKHAWYILNVSRYTEANRRRRAIANGCEWDTYTEAQVLETYGTDCHICKEPIDLDAPRANRFKGWEKGLQFDHVIPFSLSGPDTLDNVRPSHGLCNAIKFNRLGE